MAIICKEQATTRVAGLLGRSLSSGTSLELRPRAQAFLPRLQLLWTPVFIFMWAMTLIHMKETRKFARYSLLRPTLILSPVMPKGKRSKLCSPPREALAPYAFLLTPPASPRKARRSQAATLASDAKDFSYSLILTSPSRVTRARARDLTGAPPNYPSVSSEGLMPVGEAETPVKVSYSSSFATKFDRDHAPPALARIYFI